MPAVCAVGVPVLPAEVPGAAVSPGASNCSLAKLPAFTVIEELVPEALVASLRSMAVAVRAPAVLQIRLKLPVPPVKGALDGRVALASDETIPTVSATFAIRFQLASTAFTVTLNAAPAFWALTVPALPVAVPGAAVSPGANTWSLVN